MLEIHTIMCIMGDYRQPGHRQAPVTEENMRRKLTFGLLGVVSLVAVGCATSEAGPAASPTVPPAATQQAATATPEIQDGATIVDIAVEDGRFTALVTALQTTGLTETLSGEGPFTVFAPTDEAFGALPEGTVEALLGDVPALTEVLTYHVVSGKVTAADVVELESATTLQGQEVHIRVEDGHVFINDARVAVTDIEASNGIIHVIDAVLLPPA
jgi:uncharacterized surface protein with fasciclin (FAS1) repeats